LDTTPIPANTLESYYHVDGEQLERHYKEHLSGYRQWEQQDHADQWLLFPENMGTQLSIDETSLSNGELYTILTNKAAKGGKGTVIAIVKGTKAEEVMEVLDRLPDTLLEAVEEVTLDMSDSMRKIIRHCFPKASRVIDRFHVQQLAFDALQEMRISHRWDAINQETDGKENAKLDGRDFIPELFENGDTRKQLLARSRYLLFKSPEKWSESQKLRAEILFREYPDLMV